MSETNFMTVQYELNKDDYVAFSLYHHYHSPTVLKHYYRDWFIPVLMFICIFALIWYFADLERDTPLKTFINLLPLFSFVPIYLIYFPLSFRRRIKKVVKGMIDDGRNINLFGRHEVSITDDGIDDLGEYSNTSHKWPAIEKIVMFKEYIFIYLSSIEAIIIPHRAFSATEEFHSFFASASAFREKKMV